MRQLREDPRRLRPVEWIGILVVFIEIWMGYPINRLTASRDMVIVRS
jgi:hypothetical protein